MASPPNNVTPLHRGIRVIGSVDQALVDGARPFIQPETLDAIYRRHDGLDAASEQRIADLRDRLNREARHVVIEPTWLDELAEDWRDFASEVRRSPVSHALVAVLTVIGWTVLLIAPLLLGAWS
jgi:hypothetical protein